MMQRTPADIWTRAELAAPSPIDLHSSVEVTKHLLVGDAWQRIGVLMTGVVVSAPTLAADQDHPHKLNILPDEPIDPDSDYPITHPVWISHEPQQVAHERFGTVTVAYTVEPLAEWQG